MTLAKLSVKGLCFLAMRYSKRFLKGFTLTVLAIFLASGSFLMISGSTSKNAEAFCLFWLCHCESCNAPFLPPDLRDPKCVNCQDATEEAIGEVNSPLDTGGLGNHFTTLHVQLISWMIELWFEVYKYLPFVTQQLTSAAQIPAAYIGGFFDAKHQLDTQLLFDKYYVDAIRDYQPSTAMCKFGTTRRGLAATEALARTNHALLAEQSLSRHLMKSGTGAHSKDRDMINRVLQFRNVYCNPEDNVGFYGQGLCASSSSPERYNKDIDVTRTLFTPKTLDLNMADTQTSDDEVDLFTLARNIYSKQSFTSIDGQAMRGASDDEDVMRFRRLYHRYRALVAKKNVAENSFFAVAAKKGKGSGLSTRYMEQMMEQMGLQPSDFKDIYTEAPSYDAQMEILTKRTFQDPNFITNLIDKPENVDRQHAALLSLELMQERDAYNSLRRQEVLFAVMLDKLVQKRFDRAQANMARRKDN